MKFKRTISALLSAALMLSMFASTGITSVFAKASSGETSHYESEYLVTEDWIWSTDTITKNSVSYFRKDCDLKDTPTSITIKTTAHNFMKFYVNGELITGLSTPAPSTTPENKNYLKYTFTGEALTALLDPDNPNQVAFAAAVQYLGDNGMNYINGVPAFWAEIDVDYANGSDQIVTDTTWSALSNTPYKNQTPSQQNRRMTAQVDYDATKMPDANAWTEFGYDTTTYTAGAWVNAVMSKDEVHSWKLREQQIPEGAVHQTMKLTPVGVQEVGVQVYDVGQIVSGFPILEMAAPAGTKVTLRYSEDLKNGRVKHNVANEYSGNYCDLFTFSGNGVETFCPDFTYKAFRYVEIVGLPEMITGNELQVQFASTGIKNTSTFNSSDKMTNDIYDMCINTQYNNVQGMPVDCPHREQSQYLGDSQQQYDLLSYAFSDFNAINYKTLLDFSNAQYDNGSFPFITPTTTSAFNMIIPEYDLRYADLLYQYYYYSGKTDALNEFYDTSAKMVEYYTGFIDGTGLAAKTTHWSISDWPYSIVDDSGRYQTTFNLHIYDALNKMAMISTILGRDEEATSYAQRADELSAAITVNLIDPKTGMYMDSSASAARNPGVTAFAIFVGQAPQSLRTQQLDYIAEQELSGTVLPTKVIFTRAVLHVLLQGNNEHKEAAYKIMTRTGAQGWGQMIEAGDKTCWEGFTDVESHSHAWTAYPAKMFLQYILGISYNNVNFSGVTVEPYLPESMDFAEGSTQTPDGGEVEVKITRNSAQDRLLNVTTPVTTKIGVPRFVMANTKVTLGGTILFENGVETGKVDGVTYTGNNAQYIYFDVQPGTWAFSSTIATAGMEETYTLRMDATTGGTVSVDGIVVTTPYTAVVENGTIVEVVATSDKGMKFDGWSGTYGSDQSTLSFVVDSNTILSAGFSVRTDKLYNSVNIAAPEDSGLYVVYNGKEITLPASIAVQQETTVELEVFEKDGGKYNFVAWSGDLFTASRSITLTPTNETNLKVIGEYKPVENLAFGKPITSNSSYAEGNYWRPGNLTDGYSQVGPNGQLGFTSGAYNQADISAGPHEIIIDLGKDRNFDNVILYPRLDNLGPNGETLCFPETYTVQVKADGASEFNAGTTVSGRENPMSKPQIVDLGAQTGRYIRILSTKLGGAVNEGGIMKYRVQLTELEVYNTDVATSEFELNIVGKGEGRVKVNGQLETLPLSKKYVEGTHVVLESVAGADMRANGWTGDLVTGNGPVYIQMNRDIDLVADFKTTIAAKSNNYALKAGVTAASSDGAVTQWSTTNLTDGLTKSTGTSAVDGVKGYTSKNYATQDCSSDSPWVEIDLGKDTDFHQIMLYPRTDISGANGGDESPNFPTDFRVEYKMDGDNIYRNIGDLKDVPNPHGKPAELNVGLQNARYVRIMPTKLGVAAFDDKGGAKPYRFQLAEVEVYAVPSAPDNMATSAKIEASDFAANAGAWSYANIVDGKLRSEGRGTEGGIKGFTSARRKNGNTDISASPFTLDFTFDTMQTINQFVMYPRSDVDANTKNSGNSANFPVSYEVQVKNEETGKFETVYKVENGANPRMSPVECNFDAVNAKTLRLLVTKLGDPSFDETSKSHYVQLAETRISNVRTDSIATGAIKVTTGDQPTTITTATDLLNLIAEITPSDLADNNIVWSLETQDGFVANVAQLIETNTTTPSLAPLATGTAYVVARFTNGLPVMDRVQIMIENPANKKILQMVVDIANKHITDGNVDKLVPSAKAKFMGALDVAKAVLANPSSTQLQTDAAWVNLMDAIHMLSFVAGDKTMLNDLIAAANGLDLDLYDNGAIKDAFVAALATAILVQDDADAMDDTISSAVDALNKALTDMVLVLKNRTQLDFAIQQGDSYDLSLYAPVGQDAFTTALAQAKVVFADAKAQQAEIDAATIKLVKASAELRYKANKDVLEQVIKAADQIDTSLYTPESVALFRTEYNKAAEMALNPALSSDDNATINKQAQNLQDAIDLLKVKTTEETPAEMPSTPGSNPTIEDMDREITADGTVGTPSATTGENTPIAILAIMMLLTAGVVVISKKRTSK